MRLSWEKPRTVYGIRDQKHFSVAPNVVDAIWIMYGRVSGLHGRQAARQAMHLWWQPSAEWMEVGCLRCNTLMIRRLTYYRKWLSIVPRTWQGSLEAAKPLTKRRQGPETNDNRRSVLLCSVLLRRLAWQTKAAFWGSVWSEHYGAQWINR